jgi:3-phenylpropionate/trans-cinnamate dioxygenase ferredoxin subunit
MPELFKIFPSWEMATMSLPENIPRKLVLNGNVYCLVRKHNKIFAMADACPHNKASLSEGRINAFNEIICPLHEYRYDLISGSESNVRSNGLEIFPVKVEKDGVFLLI